MRAGDRVALVLPNDLDMAVAIYGGRARGWLLLPDQPVGEARPARLHARRHAGAAVLCDAELVEPVAGVARETGRGRSATVAGVEKEAGDAGDRVLDVDLASIIYTSGIDGRAQGRHPHAPQHDLRRRVDHRVAWMNSEDRVLCVLPLSFGYGLFQLLMCVRLGRDAGAGAGLRVRRAGWSSCSSGSGSRSSRAFRRSSRC